MLCGLPPRRRLRLAKPDRHENAKRRRRFKNPAPKAGPPKASPQKGRLFAEVVGPLPACQKAAVPLAEPLALQDEILGVQDGTLSRREFGIINLGGPGLVAFGNSRFDMAPRDGLYVGAGQRGFQFESAAPDDPARFYIASTPAHQSFQAHHIPFDKTRPVHLGERAKANLRTIHQYVHPQICQSAQLLMGMTLLEEGSTWNTMPCHTHDRRMEVYFYFGLPPEERVFHFMGEVEETRHLVVAPEQGVIAPSWSIHSGVGTASYSFIWSMAGENQVFDDMDFVSTAALK